MKYADNITKVFAASSGVVITMVLSTYLFDFSMTLLFNLGTGTYLVSLSLLCNNPLAEPNNTYDFVAAYSPY